MRLSGSRVKGDKGRVGSVSRTSRGDNWSLFGSEAVGQGVEPVETELTPDEVGVRHLEGVWMYRFFQA